MFKTKIGVLSDIVIPVLLQLVSQDNGRKSSSFSKEFGHILKKDGKYKN